MSPPTPKPLPNFSNLRPLHGLTRSLTDLSAPRSSMLHRSHDREHHYRPHLHRSHRAEQEREREKEKEKDAERDQELRNEEQKQVESDNEQNASANVMPPELPGIALLGLPRRGQEIKDAEIKEEKDKAILRTSELKKQLIELNDLSNNTTRQLDNTYYTILEKLSSLQNTISSLQKLATISRNLAPDFDREGQQVIERLTNQLNAFGSFKEQETKIADLRARIRKGTDSVKGLDVRVQKVQENVDAWEKMEGIWRRRMRHRMRIFWVLAIGFSILLFIFGYRHYMFARGEDEIASRGSRKPLDTLKTHQVEGSNESFEGIRQAVGGILRHTTAASAEEHAMRGLDEL